MAVTERRHIDYYFRKQGLGDDGAERVHTKIIGDLAYRYYDR